MSRFNGLNVRAVSEVSRRCLIVPVSIFTPTLFLDLPRVQSFEHWHTYRDDNLRRSIVMLL